MLKSMVNIIMRNNILWNKRRIMRNWWKIPRVVKISKQLHFLHLNKNRINDESLSKIEELTWAFILYDITFSISITKWVTMCLIIESFKLNGGWYYYYEIFELTRNRFESEQFLPLCQDIFRNKMNKLVKSTNCCPVKN